MIFNFHATIDSYALERQSPFMNYEARNFMMCTMTATGESWES
jgi:hypothetical protein